MLAYHNDPALKANLLASLEQHRLADHIVGGQYWRDGKGCSVGCALESLGQIEAAEKGDHALLGQLTGYGEMLQRLNDSIFERLTGEAKQHWPGRFAAAAEPGADLSLVPWQFLDRMLQRTFALLPDDSSVRAGCAAALAVVAAKARGEAVSVKAARAAADAANAVRAAEAAYAAACAAAYAADAAAYAADAADAADAAVRAAAYAAAYAAYAAYAAEAQQQADDLIALIAAAPVLP